MIILWECGLSLCNSALKWKFWIIKRVRIYWSAKRLSAFNERIFSMEFKHTSTHHLQTRTKCSFAINVGKSRLLSVRNCLTDFIKCLCRKTARFLLICLFQRKCISRASYNFLFFKNYPLYKKKHFCHIKSVILISSSILMVYT